jgi:hypothetical protein
VSAMPIPFDNDRSSFRKPSIGSVFSPSRMSPSAGWTWGALPTAIRQLPTLSPGAKIMYSAIAEWEATQVRVFPSVARLASDIGVSPKQARRYILELETAGLLRVTRRSVPGNAGLNDSNLYEFLYHEVFEVKKNLSIPTKLSVLPKAGVLPELSKRYSQKRESRKTIEKDHIPEVSETEKTAARIYQNHPPVRRDIGIKEITKKLSMILKHKRLRGSEANAYLQQLGNHHEKFCQSEQWHKDSGYFAKGLANWLAPTMERYDQEPPEAVIAAKQMEVRGLKAGEIE